jgi:cytochrome c-type biogenesis protein
VLAAVLALASVRGGALQASLLLAAYAAGLAVPLIASAVAFDRALGAASFLRDRYGVIRVISGIVLVALGLLVFFDRTWWLSVAVSRVLRAVGLDALTT